MIVVAVLTTNCQVSEKPNSGPDTAQTTISVSARINVIGLPANRDTALENLTKRLGWDIGISLWRRITTVSPVRSG